MLDERTVLRIGLCVCICGHNVLLSVSSVYCVKLNLGFLAACV